MTMPRFLLNLLGNRSGAAAAEMALVIPLLVVLTFGTFELGNYFFNNHIVIKGVRDGARYASRRDFADYTCPSAVDAGAIKAIQNVARTGQTADGGTPRLWTWTNTNMVTVTLACTDNSADTYSGIYKAEPNVPVVRVTATVPYQSMFGAIGLKAPAVNITAESEVPVMGL
jgi:Flp pilus assembly protein TadG